MKRASELNWCPLTPWLIQLISESDGCLAYITRGISLLKSVTQLMSLRR